MAKKQRPKPLVLMVGGGLTGMVLVRDHLASWAEEQ